MRGQSGFFDVDERLKRLSDLGDQLLAFAAAVDFEMFRAELTRALAYSDGSQGGRPPFDPVLMFKVLIVQATNNLSDAAAGHYAAIACEAARLHFHGSSSSILVLG